VEAHDRLASNLFCRLERSQISVLPPALRPADTESAWLTQSGQSQQGNRGRFCWLR